VCIKYIYVNCKFPLAESCALFFSLRYANLQHPGASDGLFADEKNYFAIPRKFFSIYCFIKSQIMTYKIMGWHFFND
jgi:hypothetical protein